MSELKLYVVVRILTEPHQTTYKPLRNAKGKIRTWEMYAAAESVCETLNENTDRTVKCFAVRMLYGNLL